MPLQPGNILGAYEVTAKIGQGGMGEVYQARDTKLDRDVALKVLPEAFTADPDRLARFEREAKVLASLNHPNIGSIYGLEEAEGVKALVLELIEGPTLADRIKQGPIPIDEALPIARQIAEALEAAHEQGVIHRDLKPANVKVKDDGTVKVLDFGLAKAFQPDAGDPSASASPTISLTAAATQMGMVIGTAAYMAPEQAKGLTVDKRADIWAYGAVLFEMLTGRKLFDAGDVSEMLASVLVKDPDISSIGNHVPVHIRSVVRRCLVKDPKERLRDIGDVRLAMSGVFETPVGVPPTASRRAQPLRFWQRPAAVAGIAMATAAVGAVAMWVLTPEPERAVSRYVVSTSADAPFTGGSPNHDLAISPDGRRVVYVAESATGRNLFVRPIDNLEGLVNLGGLSGSDSPFFSPDGAWVGYATFTDTTWKKVSVLGGPPVTLWEAPWAPRGASWGPDDTIVFAQQEPGTGLFRGPAAGGDPEVLTTPDEAQGEIAHWWPEFLPGGRAVLFTVVKGNRDQDREIAVLDLDNGEQRVLVPGGSNPRYASTGHIVYGAAGTLRAVPFDLDRLAVTGDPVPVVDNVAMKGTGAVGFALSSTGSLVYAVGGGGATELRSLVWVDREGNEEISDADPRDYAEFDLSPDGGRVALRTRRPEGSDVWVYDFSRRTSTPLTFAQETELFPLWTPDGNRVAFGTTTGPMSWKSADGTGDVEPFGEAVSRFPQAFTPDGRIVVFEQQGDGRDIGMLSLADDGTATMLLESEANERDAALSPDGRWLAYVSDESGRDEIYVRPFPDVHAGRWPISTDGGRWPVWNLAANELFYRGPTGVMAQTFEAESTFAPQELSELIEWDFPAGGNNRRMAVSPDGDRFLLLKAGAAPTTGADAGLPQVIVVENWDQELLARVPIP